MNENEKCPLIGTEHYAACCLTSTDKSCEFKHTCKMMLADQERFEKAQFALAVLDVLEISRVFLKGENHES